MAKLDQFEKLSRSERQYRYFSEDFKRKKVQEIDRGLATVIEVSRAYQVSKTAVYRWLHKYSKNIQKQERLVVESKSDTVKIGMLKDRIVELERMVGQKQIQIEFLDKLIELAGEQYGEDLKKKHSTAPLVGSGKKGKRTSTQ